MSQQDKPHKISKLLRSKAQDFLASRKNSDNLVDIIKHFESGMDMSSCLLTLEFIFTNLLKQKQMFLEITPLKPTEKSVENQYKEWLKMLYEEIFNKIVDCVECAPTKIQLQGKVTQNLYMPHLYSNVTLIIGLSTAMNLLAFEGKYPLEYKAALEHHVPINKLKLILMKILSNKNNNAHLVNKFEEYLLYDDILLHTWKILPSLTAKSKPDDIYIMNFLLLLGKLHVNKNQETQLLCVNEGNINIFFYIIFLITISLGTHGNYNYDETLSKRSLNKIWNCVMLWEHTPATHKQLLIVLLEKVLPYLDKPLMLTDFLMDSLDIGGPVSLLALQGIFIMIQTYNLTYPNIFAKLYSMFEPEIFHTKFKARLFYLSDMFLSSSHLPESLVAAFAKRLARLALIAPSEDIIIICMFIGNLILR